MRRAAVSIGGLDPCAGAGIIADVQALRLAGVWGAAVCAALTVQSTRGVMRVEPVDTALLTAQLGELLADLDVRAIKTGALGSTANAAAVMRVARRRAGTPLVVDPVLAPSRGAPDLNATGERGLPALRKLAGCAALLTPNIGEAEVLLGGSIRTSAQARDAAVALRELGAVAVLLKGGHLERPKAMVVDWLATESGARPMPHRRLKLPEVHGTGCALAALLTGRLAARRGRGRPGDDELADMVRWATSTVVGWRRSAVCVGGGLRLLGTPPGAEAIE